MKINSITGLKFLATAKSNKIKNENQDNTRVNLYNTLPLTKPVVFRGSSKNISDIQKEREMYKAFTPETKEIYNKAKMLAKVSHTKDIESYHLFLASLIMIKEYIKDLNDGVVQYDPNSNLTCSRSLQDLTTNSQEAFVNEKSRKAIEDVLDKHIKKMREEYIAPSKAVNKPTIGEPRLSKEAIDDLWPVYNSLCMAHNTNDFYDSVFFAFPQATRDRKLYKDSQELYFDLRKALGLKQTSKQKSHLTFYDDNADKIWKNIAMGNDVVVTYDDDTDAASSYLTSSFVNLINKPEQEYKGIDPKNTNIYVLNKFATSDLFLDLIKSSEKDSSKKTVIVVDFVSMVAGSIIGQSENSITVPPELFEKFSNMKNGQKNPNIRIVALMPTLTYINNTQKEKSMFSSALNTYNRITLPALNAQDAKKYLTDEKGVEYIKNTLKHDIPKETIERAVELSAQDDTEQYPQKVINLLSGLIRYNIDNKEFTPELLEEYVKESNDITQTNTSSGTTKVILNSPLGLNDIIGTPMTKAAAQNIVNRIQNGTFKTKGYTISQSNGSAYGGGRFYTAQAIAGEAKIPMFIVNAKDFALKEWDAQAQNADFSEMKIKKIVQAARAQAEANPNKTAMIYIKNFDGFGSNPLYGISSPYEQKAFNQLLEEMENTRKEGKVNLLVIGSVNIPGCLDENIMKPNQFLDSIEIYPPQDEKQTGELFKYYIDKMGIKLKGDTKEEQEKLLDEISSTAERFNPIEVVYLLETANAVMKENSHDEMDYYDFIEAYLQTTTGRINTVQEDYKRKEIVTAHETGHAIIEYVMEEIARKNGIYQEIPNELNFITLDPRGSYGGATFHKHSENTEKNLSTVMSNLASTYGGHSVEKIMYGMDGSWGITGDAEQISNLAYSAVVRMGMGKRTGVRTIFLGENFIPESKKEAIERDVDDMCAAAKEISDLIVGTYQGFIKQFSDKHAKDAGTGRGIISRSEFEKELNEYRNSLSQEEKEKLDYMEKKINTKMNSLKNKE